MGLGMGRSTGGGEEENHNQVVLHQSLFIKNVPLITGNVDFCIFILDFFLAVVFRMFPELYIYVFTVVSGMAVDCS